MNRRGVWIVVAVVALAVVAIVYFRRANREPVALDLIESFPGAEKRAVIPAEEAFSVTDVEINGEKKRAILARASGRLTWKLTVPNDATFRTDLALKPEAWDQDGDGVLFLIGVSDGRTYEDLLKQHVDPRQAPGDRRWIPITIDLSAYAGEQVSLILNTRASLPGKGDDRRNDLAVWGAPAVILRR